MSNFLIYGSYGYTGQLIVQHAVEMGFHPILAGRNEKLLSAQAQQFDLPYRTFALNEAEKLDAALLEVDAVLHFSRRSAENYVAGAKSAGVVEPALAVRHLCLSAQVAEPLTGARHIMIAARPDEAALIELLAAGPG